MHEWRLQTQVHVDPWGQAKASPPGLSPNSHSIPQPPHPTVPAHAHDTVGEPGQLCLSPTSLCSSGLSRRPWAPCPLGSRGRPSWAVRDSSICTSGTSCWPSCWLLAKRTAWWAPSMTRWGLEDRDAPHMHLHQAEWHSGLGSGRGSWPVLAHCSLPQSGPSSHRGMVSLSPASILGCLWEVDEVVYGEGLWKL